jgi:esterase/lipase superfamily enzyme
MSRLLLTIAEAEAPRSPEDEVELDGLLRMLRGTEGRSATRLSPAHALSFWLMKRRAGEVGERPGREHLAPLFAGLGDRVPRLHLIGHSFGAKLVASAVLGGLRPQSLTLLQAAFSAFAFAAEVPDTHRPGFYHRLVTEPRVTGTIAVLYSAHDRALTTLYPMVTGSAEIDRRRGARSSREVVARSALGAVGARAVEASEVESLEVQRIGLPRRPLVNVDGARAVRASEWLVGAHRDIHHPEIANLIAMAAGLRQGGTDRDHPRLLTHAPRGGTP